MNFNGPKILKTISNHFENRDVDLFNCFKSFGDSLY